MERREGPGARPLRRPRKRSRPPSSTTGSTPATPRRRPQPETVGENETALARQIGAEGIEKAAFKPTEADRPSPPIADSDGSRSAPTQAPDQRSFARKAADKADEVLRGVLGPAYKPIQGLVEMFSPGADVRDMVEGSGKVARGAVGLDGRSAAEGAAQVAGGFMGMFAPGSYSGYRTATKAGLEAADAVVEGIRHHHTPADAAKGSKGGPRAGATNRWPEIATGRYNVRSDGRMEMPGREALQLAPTTQFKDGAAGKAWQSYLETVASGVPRGFKDRAEVEVAVGRMQDKLNASGIDDAQIAMRGSSVTGYKFNKGTKQFEEVPFGSGPRGSDHDYAIVSPKLFETLRREGLELRHSGEQTVQISNEDLRRLGLNKLIPQPTRPGEKQNSIVVFRTSTSMVAQNRPYMWLNR